MLNAAFAALRYYQQVAPHLAQTYGIPYPADLEGVMLKRLEKLNTGSVD